MQPPNSFSRPREVLVQRARAFEGLGGEQARQAVDELVRDARAGEEGGGEFDRGQGGGTEQGKEVL